MENTFSKSLRKLNEHFSIIIAELEHCSLEEIEENVEDLISDINKFIEDAERVYERRNNIVREEKEFNDYQLQYIYSYDELDDVLEDFQDAFPIS